nr:immunoglobulin heavy chain junction region [Macaca mulatta]MOX59386.1 immunoglobulin heavy chain junction region [Macaca mulatta]MOX61802.1 immunoglobulin heavy chain junction region [Macaca mulatta]MOX61902.1 immunoglobulin heavy chain junction region [Macaca mulatta]MOX62087.1 immunoglobulin heavy chain junction region [Macaca mulatta]
CARDDLGTGFDYW